MAHSTDAKHHQTRPESDTGRKTTDRLSATEARQGEIVLDSGRKRRIFLVGIVVSLVLGLVIGLMFA